MKAVLSRRKVALLAVSCVALRANAQSVSAPDQTLAQAIALYTGGVQPQRGKVSITIAPLVDNGNAVPVDVRVDHPQQEGNFVSQIALFNERNPQRDVAEFELSPFSGSSQVSTRMRLATTQQIVAVAKLSDGSWWMQSAEVIVTLAACVEIE
jgi:sulfur-oxidizing protein SoxY